MEEFDFLNAFLELPEADSNPEYDAAIKSYQKSFGHIPPTAMIPDGFTKVQITDALKLCVLNHDEDLLKVLEIKIDERFIY